MSWASERRAIIFTIIGLLITAVLAFVAVTTFVEAPSCLDGRQNQDELGIDCGGSCTYLCSFSVRTPAVAFVRALPHASGRTDIAAMVVNPNPAAGARDARYRVEIFGEDRTLIATVDGSVDLPPGATVPIFMPNVYNGAVAPAQAFLSFDEASLRFERIDAEPPVFTADDVRITAADTSPRVTALMLNDSAEPLAGIKVIAFVYDENDIVIGASQTVVARASAFGDAPVTFTWNEPFIAPAARIEVRPLLPLP